MTPDEHMRFQQARESFWAARRAHWDRRRDAATQRHLEEWRDRTLFAFIWLGGLTAGAILGFALGRWWTP